MVDKHREQTELTKGTATTSDAVATQSVKRSKQDDCKKVAHAPNERSF